MEHIFEFSLMRHSIIYIFMIISYLGCQKDINPVSYNPNGTKSLKYSGIFINNDKELIFKESGDKCTKTIFVCDDSAIIKHFDYCKSTEKVYILLHYKKPDPQHIINDSLTSIIAEISQSGEYKELTTVTRRVYDSRDLSYLEIFVSPSGKYLAIEEYLFEKDGFAIFDLSAASLISFEGRPYTDHIDFMVWAPDEDYVYTKSNDYLVRYNIINKQFEMLTSPNIRSYVNEMELLKQGYVGPRIDYTGLTGYDRFKYINWSPTGWSLVYQAFDEPDIFYGYSLQDSSIQILYKMVSNADYIKNYKILWDGKVSYQQKLPDFNSNDRIVYFDESVMDSITPLNDSIFYEISQSHSISYLFPNWNQQYISWNKYFLEIISLKKNSI